MTALSGQREYVVLSVPEASFRGNEAMSTAAAPSFAFRSLGPEELLSVQKGPGFIAAAPCDVPVQLVRPASLAELDEVEPDAIGWGIRRIRAQHSQATGADITVAVLDTGIDADHEAFRGVDLLTEDFTGEGDGDGDGHGTHCAATIFGRDVSGHRIGIAPQLGRALVGKVLRSSGAGTLDALLRGIQWAVDGGADVVSLSLAIDFPGQVARLHATGLPVDVATSRALVDYSSTCRLFDHLCAYIDARSVVQNRHCVVVAAVGNESRREQNTSWTVSAASPANAEGIISVGAIGQYADGQIYVPSFSNTHPVLVAPGVNIVSARSGGGLVAMTGTSMAAPHVAGAVALWIDHLRSVGRHGLPSAVATQLLSNVDRQTHLAEQDVGYGLVQAPPGN